MCGRPYHLSWIPALLFVAQPNLKCRTWQSAAGECSKLRVSRSRGLGGHGEWKDSVPPCLTALVYSSHLWTDHWTPAGFLCAALTTKHTTTCRGMPLASFPHVGWLVLSRTWACWSVCPMQLIDTSEQVLPRNLYINQPCVAVVSCKVVSNLRSASHF